MTPEYRDVPLRRRGLNARVLSAGSGEPLLYLHGAIASTGWSPFLDIMAQEYTVHAPLQPGFGEVEGLESIADIIDMALYYFDVLDELGIKRVRVVGHFLGAMVAAEMAALCPHYVSRLALSAPTGFWRDDEPVRDIFIMSDDEIREGMWYDPQSPSAEAVLSEQASDEEKARRVLERSIDLAAAGKLLWPIPDRGLARRINPVRAPVLLVWGDTDRVVPLAYAREFSDRLENAKTAVIPRCGHLPMLEQPEDLARHVSAFFREP
jgi:pimeloyl-ACP methyl ester carboxylesterase